MRKFYSFLMLMVLSTCSVFAQNDQIEKLSDLSNSKAYTIESARAFLTVIGGGSCLYASTGTDVTATELDMTDPKNHFALINGGKNYFLYSVSAGKFVDKNGSLTDEVSADVAINVVETGSELYPFNLNWGSSNFLNIQLSNTNATGYYIDNWNTLDDGNQFQLTTVADFADEAAVKKAQDYDATIIVSKVTYIYMCDGEQAYSYTKYTKGVAPLTVEYDAPSDRIGVACADETPASKEITVDTEETVTYTYTVDLTTLPFVPASLNGKEFAEGTKWYYLKLGNTDNYCYTKTDDNGMYYENKKGINPIDLHYMFTMTGNPLSGFQIYNYVKGTEMKVQGDDSSSYGAVSFSSSSTCKYFLEAGNNDGYYRFNQTSNPDSYLHGYSGEMELYTWAGWSSTDTYSQFVIAEVSEKEMEQALLGVLSAEASIADGTMFKNGDAMDFLQIQFGSSSDDAIMIADGMEDGMIALVDGSGNVVATPAYAVNGDNKMALDITFDPEFNQEGSYALVIPAGLVVGVTSGLPNALVQLNYSFISSFEEKTVTARIWKTMDGYSSDSYPTWSTLPYETYDDGEYYTCKVKIINSATIELLDWMNAGGEKDTLMVYFDPSSTSYNGISINNKEIDEYESSWINTSAILDPTGYYGAYMYPTYSDISMDEEHGQCAIMCYSYETYDYVYILADWYMDDRYAVTETLPGKVHASAFTDLGYTDKDYPAFPQLPYTAETGTYDITVGVLNDSTIVLQNYTGAEGEDLKISFDPSLGDVNSFDDLEADEWGSSWITSSVLDGVNGGWYAYIGSYSNVYYNSESKLGYAIISGYDCNADAYYYLYVSIGGYEPVTGIKSLERTSEVTGKAGIYNLAGQRLAAPQKGVNIIDGKKVIF